MKDVRMYRMGQDGEYREILEEIRRTSRIRIIFSVVSGLAINFITLSIPYGSFFIGQASLTVAIIRWIAIILLNIILLTFIVLTYNKRQKIVELGELKGYTHEEMEEHYKELGKVVKEMKKMKKLEKKKVKLN